MTASIRLKGAITPKQKTQRLRHVSGPDDGLFACVGGQPVGAIESLHQGPDALAGCVTEQFDKVAAKSLREGIAAQEV